MEELLLDRLEVGGLFCGVLGCLEDARKSERTRLELNVVCWSISQAIAILLSYLPSQTITRLADEYTFPMKPIWFINSVLSDWLIQS